MLGHLNPALLNRQGMSTHPKMQKGSELCHWKGQLMIGLCVDPDVWLSLFAICTAASRDARTFILIGHCWLNGRSSLSLLSLSLSQWRSLPTALVVRNVHLRKCLVTCGSRILSCSIGKEWAFTQGCTMDLSFVNERDNT